jgi:phosphotransacetylase
MRGKISIASAKPLSNQRDLLLAYSPDGVTVGPVLLGAAQPAHIFTSPATVRRVINMTALAEAAAVSERAFP